MSKIRIGSVTAGLIAIVTLIYMNAILLFILIPLVVLTTLQFMAVLFLKKLDSKNAFRIVADVYSGIVSIILVTGFLILATFYIINFPPARPFEEKLTPHTVNSSEICSYQEWISLMENFKDMLPENINKNTSLKTYDYKNSQVQEYIVKTATIRNKITQFILNNEIAIPQLKEDFRGKDFGDTTNGMVDKGMNRMLAFIRLEISELKKDMDEKKLDVVREKYQSLWLFVQKMLQIKNIKLVDSLVVQNMSNELAEFYLNNNKSLIGIDLNKISVLNAVPSLIDKSMYFGFTDEYQWQKAFLQSRKYRWPAFDRNDTLKKLHDSYYKKIERIEGKNMLDENAESISRQPFWFIKNPYGNQNVFVISALYENLIDSIINKKTKVNILIYALDMNKYKNNPPIDFSTGKPIVIVDKGTYVQVLRPESKTEKSYYTIYKH